MSLFNANVSSGGGIPSLVHTTNLTQNILSRVLRLAAANKEGSDVSRSLENTGSNHHLYALDATRFIHFTRNSSNHPVAVITTVGTGTPTQTVNTIRAASASLDSVIRNPVNPLQFLVTDGGGRVHLVTAGSSGNSATISTHDLSSIVTSPQLQRRAMAAVFSAAGDAVVIGYQHSSAVALALYSISGTTLSYVNNTATTLWTTGDAVGYGALACLTGNASNEFCFSQCKIRSATNYINTLRGTFSASSVTIAMQSAVTATGSSTFNTSLLAQTAIGNVHNYVTGNIGGTPAAAQRTTVDMSGTSAIYNYTTNADQQHAYQDEYGNSGAAMTGFDYLGHYWSFTTTGAASYGTYPALWGTVGISGMNNIYTRSSSIEPIGFSVSTDYSKALLICRNTGTYYYAGFTVPTS